MKISDLRTDTALEREGKMVPWLGDTKVKLRRANNPDYRREVSEALRPYRAMIDAGTFPQEIMDKIHMTAFSHHVLVGWENFHEDDGSTREYSHAASEKMLADPELHDLYEHCLVVSSRAEEYRLRKEKESAGNSPGFSTGSKNGALSRSSSESSQGADGESTRSNENPNSRPGSKRRGRRSATTTIPAKG